MRRKKLEGFRANTLDKEVFANHAVKHDLIKCCNGHFNQKNSKVCWKCGAWLKIG